MNYAGAVQEVLGITKRIDKINDIRRELNAAITFFCSDNEFDRDVAQANVAIDAAEYTQAVALSTFTRFRKIKYIKQGGSRQALTQTNFNDLVRGCIPDYAYYIVGSDLNIKMRSLCATLDVSWFQFPPILTESGADQSFWILDIQPYMVIDRAAANIFKDIGDGASEQICRNRSTETYMAFRKDQGVANQ